MDIDDAVMVVVVIIIRINDLLELRASSLH
jgi:hypothetical protein